MISCKYPIKLTLILSHGFIPTDCWWNTDKDSVFCAAARTAFIYKSESFKDIVTNLVKILIFDMIGILKIGLIIGFLEFIKLNQILIFSFKLVLYKKYFVHNFCCADRSLQRKRLQNLKPRISLFSRKKWNISLLVSQSQNCHCAAFFDFQNLQWCIFSEII